MKVLSRLLSGMLLFAVVISLSPTDVLAQDPNPAATDQYGVAVRLQNTGAYDLAAEQWTKFITDFATDARVDRANHYRGICYLKSNKLDDALKSFQTVVTKYPKSKVLEQASLYLGVTQYSLGQSGKAEMYDAAAATFGKMITDYPTGKYLAQAIFYRGECLYARDKKEEAAKMYGQLVEKFPESNLAGNALYALGVTQEELGQHAEAGKAYDSFLAKYPEDPLGVEVGMRKAETQFAAGQYAEAAAGFAKAAAAPKFALADHATVRQAASLSQLKKYAEAAALYASLPTKFPKSALIGAANLAGGKCYYLAGDFASAQKLLGTVIAAGGADLPEAAHWTARAMLKENKAAEALAVAAAAIPKAAESPLLPQLLMDQADATYEIAEQRAKSIALYVALAKKYPEDASAPQALYMAGFASLGEGDYETAGKYAAEFLAAHPGSDLLVDVTYVAAESNLQLKKFADAEKLFGELIKKYPKHADAEAWKVRYGLSMHLQKKYAETAAALQPLLAEIKTPAAAAEAQYLVGSSQAELKKYAEAIGPLAASLKADPKWRQADDTMLVLAHCQYRLKKADEAKATLAKLVADFPKSRLLDRAHYRLGEYAFAAGDFKTAEAEYQKVIDGWPKSTLLPYASYGLGWTKLSAKDYEGAETVLSGLIEKNPEHRLIPRAQYARGMARQQLGKFEPAVADIQAFLKADPTAAEKSDAQYVLGLCRAGLKKYDEAATTFQALLKEDAEYAGTDKVLYELAWSLKSQEKEKEAAETFAKLAADHADSKLMPESQYHVGEFEYKSKDFKKAAVAYYAAMNGAGKTELGEKSAHKLAWAYYRSDDLDNAQKTFAYQRSTWPEGPLLADATFMEAECLGKQDKYKEALALYEQVKDPSGKDFEVLTLLHGGQAAAQVKDWEKSLAMLTQCTEKFPDTPHLPEALYEQGWAQQNLGKLAEATALYKQVIAKTRREVAARAQFMIGEIEFEQKKHAEAVSSFFKVSYGYGYPKWQAQAHFEAGRCFEVLGKKPQALKQYQELVEKYPDSDKAPLAKKRIDELK